MEYPKFVLGKDSDGAIWLATKVTEFHSEILSSDDYKILGGGFYHRENDAFYLYGSSVDFGHISLKNLKEAIIPPSLEKIDVFFSKEETPEKAKLNNVKVIFTDIIKQNDCYVKTVDGIIDDIRCGNCGTWLNSIPKENWECSHCKKRYNMNGQRIATQNYQDSEGNI
jgi:hypothetical protein